MIKKSELPSTCFGLYPFTVEAFRVTVRPSADSKTGTRRVVYINAETDVQVVYMTSKVRFFDMTDPAENKAYWDGRKATKAAYFRSRGWRK